MSESSHESTAEASQRQVLGVAVRGCPVCGVETLAEHCPTCGCTTWDDPVEAALAQDLAKALSRRIRGQIDPALQRAMRRARRKTVKQKLRAALEQKGFDVRWITGAQGYYRISKNLDDTTTCWDAAVSRNGRLMIIHSYDTMTACVRHGFEVAEDQLPVMVFARPES